MRVLAGSWLMHLLLFKLTRMKIKEFNSSLVVVIHLMIFLSMAVVTVSLFMQYKFFKEQAERMLELQKDYQEYLSSLKQLYLLKKKETNANVVAQNLLEEVHDVHSEPLLKPVNREVAYLKKAAVGFGKANNLEKVVKPLYEGGTWDTNYSSVIRSCLVPNKQSLASKKLNYSSVPPNLYDFSLSWPISEKQFWISSYFGPRKKKFHYGIDMAAYKGTRVYAAAEGIITEVSDTPKGYGKSIVIRHKKCKTRYAHLNEFYVVVGQRVKSSQLIGCVGDTGLVRGKHDPSHLHFEVIDLFGKRINPLYILR
jgi:murein DD-endopeptidase MepM/ murein hydrolase activator NlpD